MNIFITTKYFRVKEREEREREKKITHKSDNIFVMKAKEKIHSYLLK